ncbi:hypothetical protein GGI11_006982 [Coemansia sp. RSA 2049]|nr:hypothetical protein GGI11_006982 [Coemansia sp. RSA 2049]KAJ2511424.1 hypothetical protein H4217_007393 [Coemansia sp. RSA 1939]KAJ2609729.1 hypothetical protein EV177_004330 [Coemansia sp. RSA 1804]KAJ2682765.1 hypothetical protein GGH99_004607 [Coemansia sp. RSA 1285]
MVFAFTAYPFLLLGVVIAHTQTYNIGVDGVLGKDFQYRVASDYGNAPIQDLASDALRCRSKRAITSAGVDKLAVEAGQTVTLRWDHANNTVVLPVLPRSHQGPCMVYMAALSTQGDNDAWFKIYEGGFDATQKKWCATRLIDNWGILNVTVPRNIPSGDYLVRSEVLALHPTLVRGATQFYPNCFIATVANGAAATLPRLYPIPGIYGYDDPGVYFSRAQDPTSYTIPGPPLFTDGGDPP